MANVRIVFQRCHQDSQDYGSDDEHMVSRVFFLIEVNGKQGQDSPYHADIKQVVGGQFEHDSIEVSLPYGASGESYRGPMNYEAYRAAVEGYYRGLVGSGGTVIRIQGGSNIRMRNNMFSKPMVVSFDAADTAPQW
ncbi:MAG: hypothetical protein HYX99_03520 [Chloroflexi bacterium]|nr:hypothetical protein [Chloroflexota bacterium]